MSHPFGSPAPLVLALLLPALAAAQEPPRKAPDVMTVNGAQVATPASVPDRTAPALARAGRAAPRVFASRTEYEAALAEARAAALARTAAPPARAASKPGVERPAAGSLPSLLGPLPRPEWNAAATPVGSKPADVVTIGEATGIDAPPATAAPAAAPPRAGKAIRDLATTRARDAAAPPPSPAKPEVRR